MRRYILPTIVILTAACGNVLSSKNAAEKDELVHFTSKNHEEQRRAMLRALDDNNSASLFVSPQEQRSQYYLHEGLNSAIERSLRMANFDVDSLWDYLDDIMGEEEGADADEDLGMAYPQFLEDVLTDMIREVEDSLQKISTKGDDVTPMETTIPKQEEADDGDSNTHTRNETSSDADTIGVNSSSGVASNDNSIGPRDAILRAFDKIHEDLQCDNYKNDVTVNDPQGKWDNITKAYWNFFNLDPPTKLDPPVSDDDYDFYTTDGNVYFDFLHNVRVPYLPKQTTRRGMFAARDFERDELVYSYMANGLFFLELSTFEAFIRNSSLLPAYDACLLARWSFAQKLTRPGRYYICSSLDAGAYFNSGEGRRVNVYVEDTRDLNYYASRNIAKGEEIIYYTSS